jgi:nitrite reductase/ring-hydroxylating ferredoxin subunit/alkylhydroperoxidase/carboxymuconolactone decarboxylase family protein YurZ
MSDALDYLLKARPEAMQAYFAFLREAGKGLDPKTRALISVITKVDRQTAAGFRQYLKRALREGAGAGEVLDALLMAFPTLGLTKILWAVDQLQAMDLPEFRLDSLAAPRWRDAAAAADVPPGATRHVTCDGRGLFLHAAAGGLRVYDGRCPHQSTAIPADAVDGATLTCPKHRWRFDLDSGACVSGGDQPLHRLAHRVVDGRIQVQW